VRHEISFGAFDGGGAFPRGLTMGSFVGSPTLPSSQNTEQNLALQG